MEHAFAVESMETGNGEELGIVLEPGRFRLLVEEAEASLSPAELDELSGMIARMRALLEAQA